MTKTIKNTMNLEDMKVKQGISFLEELYEKNPLGTEDEVVFKETIHKLKQLYKAQERQSKSWEVIKVKLTSKQLLYVLENL